MLTYVRWPVQPSARETSVQEPRTFSALQRPSNHDGLSVLILIRWANLAARTRSRPRPWRSRYPKSFVVPVLELLAIGLKL